DLLMPEPDRLSPARLPALLPGLDPELAERLARLPGGDAALARAMLHRPVVVGVAGLDGREATSARSALPQVPVRLVGGDARAFVRPFEAALRSIDAIDAAAAGRGLLSVDLERGVVRRLPLVAAIGPTLIPTLGLELLRVASGEPGFSVRVGPGGIEAVGVGDVVVPTEPDGSVWLHFTRHDRGRFVSAVDVLAGRVPAEELSRALVLVGPTAVALSDYQVTPVEEQMPGVETHAHPLESIADGDLLSRPRGSRWAEAGLLAAAGLLLVIAVPAAPISRAVALWAAVATSSL